MDPERLDGSHDEDSDPDAIDGPDLPSDEEERYTLTPRDRTRSTYYNHKIEKQLITTESKHIYQRHQLESAQHDGEFQSPLARTSTFPSVVGMDHIGRTRSESVATRTTGRNYSNRQRTPSSLNLAPRDELEESTELGTYHGKHPVVTESSASSVLGQEPATPDLNEVVGHSISGRSVLPEVSDICRNIQKVLDIRRRYINISLQEPKHDPRNHENWKIYPPPPDPVWYEDRDRPFHSNWASASTFTDSNAQQTPKLRKAGQNIGADFDVSELLPLPGVSGQTTYELDQSSVYQVYKSQQALEAQEPIVQVPTLRQYYKDKDKFIDYSADGPSKSYTYRQLEILDSKFNLHKMENSYQEHTDCKKVPHRDFYNVRKVDTHVHHSACMNQKHLLRYMKSKVKKSPDEIVANRDGIDLTLAEVFSRLKLTAYDLSIDTLDMHVCRCQSP